MGTDALNPKPSKGEMMREIKFRAWDGQLMHTVDTIEFPVGGVRWFGPGVGQGIVEANPLFDWKVDSILMQYTGLKDKNGKEIYEGDIVKAETLGAKENRSYIGEIVYTAHETQFRAKEPHWSSHIFYPNHTEIIGNIHEHPELLTHPAEGRN